MSKYEPLTAFLKQANGRNLRLTFAEIEQVLGFPLPASKRYPAWWSNNATNNMMTKAWLSAGYKTAQIDVSEEKVTFHSEAAPKPMAPRVLLSTGRVSPRPSGPHSYRHRASP